MVDDRSNKHRMVALFFLALVYLSIIHFSHYASVSSPISLNPIAAEVGLVGDASPSPDSRFSLPSPQSSLGGDSVSRFLEPVQPVKFCRTVILPTQTDQGTPGLVQVCSPTRRVISVLHKKHTWHQSSEDDPLPRGLSFF